MLHARDRDRALGAADRGGDGAARFQRGGAAGDERLAARVEAVRAELRAEAGLFGGLRGRRRVSCRAVQELRSSSFGRGQRAAFFSVVQ